MRIVTAMRHQSCSRCSELQTQLLLVARESGLISAKISEGRWPFNHWAKTVGRIER